MRARGVLSQLAEAGICPRGMSVDSRSVRDGDVFVAWPGAANDGRRHIDAALSRGAAAALYESSDGFRFSGTGLPVFAVEGLRALAGFLADEIYGKPSEKLWLAGVTGTNGKTSISHWIGRALETLGNPCGIIGTLGCGFPDALVAGVNTTPEAVDVHRLLAGFLASGAHAAVMEVSSIGVDQGRVNGARFDVGVLTNLTQDHLDYHGTMLAYGEAKARFLDLPEAGAAINLDDGFSAEQAARLAARGKRIIGFSLNERVSAPAGVEKLAASDLRSNPSGLCFDALWEGCRVALDVSLVGMFNASNLLAVVGALLLRGEALDEIAEAVKTLTPPPGRMQWVGGDAEPLVVVDYAHTPDALAKALEAVRGTAKSRGGRLICVFGCGGERDTGKRPLMGEAAARLADWALVTSDNPRFESPQKIIADILRGMEPTADVVEDRAEAIRAAVDAAKDEDVILVAGKGHEPYQEICGKRYPFSDCEQARLALAARGRALP